MRPLVGLFVALGASSFFISVIPTGAASLVSIYGGVRANSGSGFHQVGDGAQVASGTSVMAAPGGSAEILYSDGCRIPVRPGVVEVVAPISPCALGQKPQSSSFYDVLGAGAVIGGSVFAGVWSAQHTSTQHNNQTSGNPPLGSPPPVSP
jgi:hypothetical protein